MNRLNSIQETIVERGNIEGVTVDLVSPLGDLHNLLHIRVSAEVGAREDQLPINFYLQGI